MTVFCWILIGRLVLALVIYIEILLIALENVFVLSRSRFPFIEGDNIFLSQDIY